MDIFSHSLLKISSNSLLFDGCFLLTSRSNNSHRFSNNSHRFSNNSHRFAMGFRSGDCDDQCKILTSLSLKTFELRYLSTLDHFLLEYASRSHFSRKCGTMCSPRISQYNGRQGPLSLRPIPSRKNAPVNMWDKINNLISNIPFPTLHHY